MYKQEDFESINQQFKRRAFLLLLPEIVLLTALVVSFIMRIQWLTVLLLCLMIAVFIFAWGVSLSPLASYRKYLQDLLTGRKRDYIGSFQGFDHDEVIRDGVSFTSFMLNVGNSLEQNDDRLLYFDRAFPLPTWQEGLRLHISTFDKSVVDWKEEGLLF